MKRVTVKKAGPRYKGDDVEPVVIVIDDSMTSDLTDEDMAANQRGFGEDARTLFYALRAVLPGGTFCQLTGLMLQEKASHFIVSHKPTSEYRKMEAASELYEACKETLGEMRAYNAESEFDESCPMKPIFDQLKAAIAKADGEEAQDG